MPYDQDDQVTGGAYSVPVTPQAPTPRVQAPLPLAEGLPSVLQQAITPAVERMLSGYCSTGTPPRTYRRGTWAAKLLDSPGSDLLLIVVVIPTPAGAALAHLREAGLAIANDGMPARWLSSRVMTLPVSRLRLSVPDFDAVVHVLIALIHAPASLADAVRDRNVRGVEALHPAVSELEYQHACA